MGFFLALFVVGLVYFEISHDTVNNLEKKARDQINSRWPRHDNDKRG